MKIEKTNIENCILISPDEGNVLTFYQDTEDINTYVGVKKIYASASIDLNSIREITMEQHLNYLSNKTENSQHEEE
jgi:hypothetical protein